MGDRIYRWKKPLWLTNGKLVGHIDKGGEAFIDPDQPLTDIGKQIIEHCEKEAGDIPETPKKKNTK